MARCCRTSSSADSDRRRRRRETVRTDTQGTTLLPRPVHSGRQALVPQVIEYPVARSAWTRVVTRRIQCSPEDQPDAVYVVAHPLAETAAASVQTLLTKIVEKPGPR